MATIFDMIVVAHDSATADAQRDLIAENGQNGLAGLKIKDYFKNITSGIRPGVVQTKVNLAKASGTFTVGTMVANDTITINGIVFTAVGTAATALQFTIGGDAPTTATNAAAKFNADTTLDGMVIASVSTSVITITALVPGELGNAVTIANSANATASGARLTGGTNGDVERTHYYGSGA
jgi:phage tail sheath gpL-like